MSIDGTEDIRSGVKRLLQRCLCANSEVAGCLLGLILSMRSTDLLQSFASTSDTKHTMIFRALGASVLCLLLVPAYARASSLTVSGYLNDPANAALLASDGYLDLRPPRFADDSEIARNVAVYLLTVTTGGVFSFDSFGYAAFGAEPYFSLFSGSGLDAGFLTSNGIEDPINIDFSLSRALAPGDYLLAIGVWVNMSFAENNPDGTPAIGDGFTALGDPFRLGNTYYELGVSSVNGEARAVPKGDLRNEPQPQTVPEPSAFLMLASGLVGVARIVRRRTSIAPMLLRSSFVHGSRACRAGFRKRASRTGFRGQER